MRGGSPPLSTLLSLISPLSTLPSQLSPLLSKLSTLPPPPSNKKEKSCASFRTVTSPFFISLLKHHLVRSHFSFGCAHHDDV